MTSEPWYQITITEARHHRIGPKRPRSETPKYRKIPLAVREQIAALAGSVCTFTGKRYNGHSAEPIHTIVAVVRTLEDINRIRALITVLAHQHDHPITTSVVRLHSVEVHTA